MSILASEHNTRVLGSEIVGLVPLAAMLDAGKWFLDNESCSDNEYVEAAINGLGLSYLEDFLIKCSNYRMGNKE